MVEVKLIHFIGCFNVDEVKSALVTLGVEFDVIKLDDLPRNHFYSQYSSPTILKGDTIIFGSKTSLNSLSCSFEKIDVEVIKRKLFY